MKKILFICLLCILFTGCYRTNKIIGLSVGDKRTTETEHYIYIEECTGFNGLGMAFWKFKKIINKDNDSLPTN